MNTQTVIQALINDKLIVAAKMYAHGSEMDKVAMLCACATGKALDQRSVSTVMVELREHPDMY